MVKVKTIYYKDREFKSLKEVAEYAGITTATLHNRLNTGCSLEEAIESKPEVVKVRKSKVKRARNKVDLVERDRRLKIGILRRNGLDEIEWEDVLCINGVKYSSIDELASNIDISITTLIVRLKNGWKLKDAIEKPVNRVDIDLEYEGVKYKSIGKLADVYGVNSSALTYRLKNGWEIKDALTKDIRDNYTEVTYKGVKYKSIADLAREMGIETHTVRYRLKAGATIGEAIKKEIASKRRKVIEYKGKRYATIKEFAKEQNINVATLDSRLKNGWSLEEAVELKPGEKRENTVRKKISNRKGKEVEYKGKRYISTAELAKEHNISVQGLVYRLHKGMSLEEALNKPVRGSKK